MGKIADIFSTLGGFFLMKIYNRRYTGSKYKLIPWITEILKKSCVDCNSFFDVFGGTGVVTDSVLNLYTS